MDHVTTYNAGGNLFVQGSGRSLDDAPGFGAGTAYQVKDAEVRYKSFAKDLLVGDGPKKCPVAEVGLGGNHPP